MNSIELKAYAKVNLLLKVLSKRKDGYHNLLTIFERISLADHIKISKIPEGIIVTCDKAVTAKSTDNIAYKAAKLILMTSKAKSGIRIHIQKRIPIAAGLGGGSADAAAVLVGINKLLNFNISKEKLMRLGSKLGADVPFFIFNTPFAIGRGIGDELEKLNLRAKFFHILIYPGFKVATKEVYQALDLGLTRKNSGDRMAIPVSCDDVGSFIYNDLGGVVAAKKPIIGKIIRRLASSLGRRAMVSGSGPSVFCLYRTRREAIGARRELLRGLPVSLTRRWQLFIVETKA